jgi:hypothetical protein
MTPAARGTACSSDGTLGAGRKRPGALRAAAPYTSAAQNAWMRVQASFRFSSEVA